MIDWDGLALISYIIMRMSGFILLNPILGRRNIPAMFSAGFIMLLSVLVYTAYPYTVTAPNTLIQFSVRLLLEFFLGYIVAIIISFFLYIPEQAGEVIDTQMGMSMGKVYDSGSQSSMTTTATMLNMLMLLLFFVANGHITLLRIMVTSGEIVPFGSVALSDALYNHIIMLFIECTVLAVKMCLPILAAELLGQVGMGILMKVIPQINVFAINIELKVIVGLIMLLIMISPFSEFLLRVEADMLLQIQNTLALVG